MAENNSPNTSSNIPGALKSDGHAMDAASDEKLPDEITTTSVTHYQVGSYTYTNRKDAMAEFHRQKGK